MLGDGRDMKLVYRGALLFRLLAPVRGNIAEQRGTRMIGYAGPANAKAGEVYSKYVITDMFAKGVQGLKAEDAVKWAEGELKRVYES